MALSKISLTGNGIENTLPIANGGTAVTTAADLANTGNMVLLSSITASDTTNIVFDNTVITDTYDSYMLTFRDIDLGTDSTSIYLTVSGDNGSSYITSSSYKRAVMNGDHGDTNDSNMTFKTGGQTQVNLIGAGAAGGSVDKESSAGTVWMFNLRKADRGKVFLNTSFYEDAAEQGRLNQGGAYLDDATVINNIKISPSSGDFNEGTFTLYGFKE
jgi:hypothetical protein